MKPPFHCPWCNAKQAKAAPDNAQEFYADEHLVVLMSGDHIHVHGPIEKKETLREMIRAIECETGLSEEEKVQVRVAEIKEMGKATNQDTRKIVFGHHRAIGDALMFTCGIRDFKLLFPDIVVGVDTNFPQVFENNPYIDHTLRKDQPGVEYYRVGYPAIGSANNTNVHFTMMFLLDMIAASDLYQRLPISLGEFCSAFSNGEVGDPCLGNPEKNNEAREPYITLKSKYQNFCKKFSRMYPDIHLTEEEMKRNIIRDVYGVSEPYWVVAPGGKRDCTSKIWDWRRFVDVVDHFRGRIRFVTIGRSDHIVEKIPGTIDLTDKFNGDIRGLFSLIYNAEGCVSGISFLHHAAAGMPPKKGKGRMPCVTIVGGREPTGMTWYTNHQILHTNGVFSCCSSGGCWTSRTYPIPKDPKLNTNLCRKPIESAGRTIQSCMDIITSADVIRCIERYYEGDLYRYGKTEGLVDLPKTISKEPVRVEVCETVPKKLINLVGNLHVDGGGEQSLCMIARVLKRNGWSPRLYSWQGIHRKMRVVFDDLEDGVFQDPTFQDGMLEHMVEGVPLLFYANDRTRDFCEKAQGIVEKSSAVIIGINYVNRPITTCEWLARSGKVKGLIFQNREKAQEFDRDAIGYDKAKRYVLFGAIDLDKYLPVCTPQRKKDDQFVVLKHCVPDYRKYVTSRSENKGDRIHLWQKHLDKDNDIKFYTRLLNDFKDVRFEFMEAHEELVSHFKGEPRMVFHKWDAMPVPEFLSRGHAYLYRTSNLWRDQYPRVVAEALAAGLPILSEPRDGTKDRIEFGDTGFYCIDYDGYKYALKLLMRKENYRYEMCRNAKDWARTNLNPEKWVEVISEILSA
jgi:ADP-heptose:LPS heptosyltransferase